jgi:DNA-binding response OmpR family regulator
MPTHNALVIDDDREISELVCLHLVDAGLECDQAGESKTAIDYLQQKSYDLVLLDIGLPDISGLEFLEKFHFMFEHSKVIMITAFNEADMAVKALKLGAVDYLVKPINFLRILDVVERYVLHIKEPAQFTFQKRKEPTAPEFSEMDALAIGVRAKLEDKHDLDDKIITRTVKLAEKMGIDKNAIVQWTEARKQRY